MASPKKIAVIPAGDVFFLSKFVVAMSGRKQRSSRTSSIFFLGLTPHKAFILGTENGLPPEIPLRFAALQTHDMRTHVEFGNSAPSQVVFSRSRGTPNHKNRKRKLKKSGNRLPDR